MSWKNRPDEKKQLYAANKRNKRAADRGEDPIFKVYTGEYLAGQIAHGHHVQATQRKRSRIKDLPPTPSPSPHTPPESFTSITPVELSTEILGLPVGYLLHPALLTELQEIASAAQSVFKEVGLDGWSMKEGTVDMVQFRSAEKWGGEWVIASTFLHLERLDAQKLLRKEVDGFVHIGDHCDAWEKLRTELLVLQGRVGDILSRCDGDGAGGAYELPGCDSPVGIRTKLLAVTHQLSVVSTFALVMGMIIQDELNVWYGEGQWKAGSNASVKKALQRRVNSGAGSQKFRNRRYTFTVRCLLPGEWLNGEVINFFVDFWQPPVQDGVLLMDTLFWVERLKKVTSVRKSEGWDEVLTDPVLMGRSYIKRLVMPIHHGGNHWITACIDFNSLSIMLYDSWATTFNKNRTLKREESEHWQYVTNLMLLVEKLASLNSFSVRHPVWDDWKLVPHVEVPLQNNGSDCGVFALLFLLHLRHGGINHIHVPVQYRMEMEGRLAGKVAGGLLGVRLSLVEVILSSAEHFDSRAADAPNVIDLTDD